MEHSIRILVVEDKGEKLRRILGAIGCVISIYDGVVDDVRDLTSARRLLRDNEYDLLVLDIAVPRRSDEAPAPYAGVEFLEELSERAGVYRMPQHIVGLTAHDELLSIAGRRFSEQLWLVIRYDEGSTEWEAQLQRRVEHILHAMSGAQAPNTARLSIEALIGAGESESIEFKETLRWNIQAKRDDDRIWQVALKTVTGFLNSAGGTLLVGVSNDGEVTGLDPDHFANEDQAMLFLTQLIRTRVSHAHMRFIKIRIETIRDKRVMRVDCGRAKDPAYVRLGSGESFYVRTGPSTNELPVSEVHRYIDSWFK